MKTARLVAAFTAAVLLALPAHAQVQTLTFEGISPRYPFIVPVMTLDFYNGGTSAAGTSGPNYGVQFSDNAAAVCLNSMTQFCGLASRGGLGDPASAQSALFILEGDMAVMNRPAGMINNISFNYVTSNSGGTFWVWSGLNATGQLLGSVSLPENTSETCIEDYLAFFCPFQPMSLDFAGVARSAVFTGVENAAAIDDVRFEFAIVPEPSTVFLVTLGLGAIGVAARRRTTKPPTIPRTT